MSFCLCRKRKMKTNRKIDHIISSYHMDKEDLDYNPFDGKGGRGRMYHLFDDEMNGIIEELNEVLVA